jgi:hypothetical protein
MPNRIICASLRSLSDFNALHAYSAICPLHAAAARA